MLMFFLVKNGCVRPPNGRRLKCPKLKRSDSETVLASISGEWGLTVPGHINILLIHKTTMLCSF